MGMFINTNIAAINAQRNLSLTGAKMAKALERLSSGLRINRAADDAAGLSISEALRAQIRGLKQGSRNAQDAISMVQTAEGALNEVHGILQRMRELTIQAGNSTLSSEDRKAIGNEIETLKNEINNIANRTTFNGLSLLTGALATADQEAVGALPNYITTATADTDASDDTVQVTVQLDKAVVQNGIYTLADTGNADQISMTSNVAGQEGVVQTITISDVSGAGQSDTYDFSAFGVKLTITNQNEAGGDNALAAADIVDDLVANAAALTVQDVAGTGSGADASFQVGSSTAAADRISVSFGDMRASNLGGSGTELTTLITDGDSVSTVSLANALTDAIDNAIISVSSQRGKLGAAQNQVEFAINSIGVSVENLSASESRIRDADIAEVSTELVTRQIMQQAGVAVLAQANVSAQSVLALLR